MKKIISLILCAALAFSLAVPAFAAESPVVITVANDLHLDLDDSFAESVSKRNSVSEEYAHVSSGGQLTYESYAIIKAFLEKAATNNSKYVILPGDLANSGLIEEHEFLASMLREFEETSGKEVYVAPGNHDLFKTSLQEFESIYAEFGFNDAYAKDTKSATYLAELDNNYVILSIDSCTPKKSPHGMTEERIDWIEAQVKSAKAQGKKVIAMLHHNLVEHYILQAKIHTGAVVTKESTRLADVLADNGVKYVFTAHTHSHDITSYTSPSGNTLYEAVTNSLTQYPCAYRVVSFGEKAEFTVDYVRKIDTSLLPAGIHEAALSLAESNFLMYAKNCTYLGINNIVSSYVKASQLKKILKTDDETINSVVDRAAVKLEEIARLPIYEKDAAEGETSLEIMAEELDITLPETDYYNLLELATEIYQSQSTGDENYAAYTDEMILFTRLLAVAINYAFSDVTTEEFTLVLTYVANLLGVDISQDIINAVGGSLDKFRGAELFVTSVALPILSMYGQDQGIADNNVSLPGYDSTQKSAESLLDMIKNFFKKIFDFFHTLFAMIA